MRCLINLLRGSNPIPTLISATVREGTEKREGGEYGIALLVWCNLALSAVRVTRADTPDAMPCPPPRQA